jgi:tetratricopeptide (TPR) repeat protein
MSLVAPPQGPGGDSPDAGLETAPGKRTPAGDRSDADRPSAEIETGGETATGNDDPADAELPAGTRAGRYMLLSRIGKGGAGHVYAAYDPQLDRKVAIKLLRGVGETETLQSGQARLLREGQAMARLKHPNVLPVYDVGTLEHHGVSSVFVAMELVEGGTLRQWLKTPHSRREIVDTLTAAGRGLAAAHAAGLVHRDFKPDNVLLDPGGRVFVTDFGIVRAADGGDEDRPREGRPPDDLLATPLTQLGAVIGTPAYMAPEQYKGDRVDARSDQFSFCVTLYEALTGERPFHGRTFDELMAATVAGRITTAPRQGELPAWLRRVVLRGLEVDPALRYATMNELLAALAADPVGRRRRILAYVGGLALLTVAGAGVARVSSRNHEMCRGGQAKLAGAWDAGVRARLERAFAGSGASSAARIATTVSGLLDDYADHWAVMYGESCEATRVRGEQPESVMQLRMSCLDGRLHELRTLTGMFADADAALVQKAIDATAGLSSLQRCADVPALSAPVPPPADGATRTRVDQLRSRVAEMKALDAAGRSKSVLAESESLVASARALGYGPLLAETLQVRGSLLDSEGEHQAAESVLYEAFTTAYGAHHDAAAADVAEDLISLVGYWLARPADGHRWAEMSLAAIHRLGGNDELEAWLRRDEAWVDYQEGNAQRSVADAERALELGKKVFRPDHVKLAKIHATLATAYGMQRRYDEAIAENHHALEILQKTFGPEHPSNASVLTSLGNDYNDQKRFSEAEGYFRRAFTIAEKAFGADHPTTAISHLNLGDALMSENRTDEAIGHFQATLAIAEKRLGPDHPLVVRALEGLGFCQLRLGHGGEAVQTLERAATLVQKKGMPGGLRREVSFDLARVLWETGRNRPRALALANQVHADAEKDGDRATADEVATWQSKHH